MSNIVKIIGSIVVALFMYSVPVITTCAFAFDWNGLIKLILLTTSFIQLVLIVSAILDKVEEGL